MPGIREEINDLISKGRTRQALDRAVAFAKTHQHPLENDLVQLKGRFSGIERDRRMGVIGFENERVASAQIVNALVELSGELESTSSSQSPGGNATPTTPQKPTTILFLAANPTDTGRLRLDKEVREIDNSLRQSNERDRFELKSQFAVRISDLRRAFLRETPSIVHFSGHGFGPNDGETTPDSRALHFEPEEVADPAGLGIALEGEDGKTQLVRTEALADFFSLFSGEVACVLLNSCYSHAQAEAIAHSVPIVVGMRNAVPDATAITFATAFYDAIGAGRPFEFAYKLAKNAIAQENLSGDDLPIIWVKGQRQ